MSIQIEMFGDCPFCKEHVPYHCETEEKAKDCNWWQRQNNKIADAASFSMLKSYLDDKESES